MPGGAVCSVYMQKEFEKGYIIYLCKINKYVRNKEPCLTKSNQRYISLATSHKSTVLLLLLLTPVSNKLMNFFIFV